MLACGNRQRIFAEVCGHENRPIPPYDLSPYAKFEDREPSLTSLVQVRRVVLDTVKLPDRGEVNDESPGLTDEELEKLLGEGTSEEDD